MLLVFLSSVAGTWEKTCGLEKFKIVFLLEKSSVGDWYWLGSRVVRNSMQEKVFLFVFYFILSFFNLHSYLVGIL